VGEPSFALDYVAFLSGKIRFLNERLSELSAPSALQKLSSYLLKDDGRIALSKVQLASALGIGRASLYRALDDLTEKGYISSDGKSVTVIDREGLMSLI
jgi:CRP-like cAMP-binding protein